MIDLGNVLVAVVPAVLAIGVAARQWWQARRRVGEYKALAVEARYAVEQLVAADEGKPDRLRTGDEPALPPVPAKLISACAAGDGVLFMGTGISAAAGQPTWSEALLAVLRICEHT